MIAARHPVEERFRIATNQPCKLRFARRIAHGIRSRHELIAGLERFRIELRYRLVARRLRVCSKAFSDRPDREARYRSEPKQPRNPRANAIS
jgi:hypothetical protein